MKKFCIAVILFFCLPFCVHAECFVEAYFSPYDDIETLVIEKLSEAEKSIHCSLYGITNKKIKTLIGRIEKGLM